eukprot:CAMPEP_0113713718 /NCGR_PEP_ID=MMETSP0038_2-20120614/32170_1 /TAXON_ID=2898 /ORGANISM="Cryptomonas paramecium" /LENGTH=513 /DNA_ID=CAMNT_0000640521 /DNA_START=275 /DNA_END=1812 /DNA_ORIENTATION=- /assembly_acc=CAM_ASM_000170
MSSLLKFNPCASEFVPSFGAWQEPQFPVITATATPLGAVEAAPSCSDSNKPNHDDFAGGVCLKTTPESSNGAQDIPIEMESLEPTAVPPRKGSLTAAMEGSDKSTPQGLDYELWSEDEPPTLVWSRSFDERELRAMEEEVEQSDSSDSTVRFPSGGSGSDEPAADNIATDDNNIDSEQPHDENAAISDAPPQHRASRHRSSSGRRVSSKKDAGEKKEAEAGKEGGAAAAEAAPPVIKSRVTVDDFEILCMVGQGGFGKVFQVRKKDASRAVLAMKCMRKDVVVKDNLQGTRNERLILSSVRHPYIVNMHYAFQCKGRLYLVMDYFPGGQFLDMLHNHAPFSAEAYVLYTGEVALALGELHSRGIVHRDLKPENLLVDGEGHLVMTDFGCSKISDEGGSVRTESWAGTELYMAPEQLQKASYGSEVDWWALGALTWEMCTGENPFYHDNRKVLYNNILRKKLSLPSWLPPPVHSLLKGLLTRDPARRLGHARGFDEVQSHAFFKALRWDALQSR